MPWNGSGAFQRTDGTRTGADVWAQAKAAGVKITTAGHDAHDEDVASGLEACWNRNGENALTADVSAGGFSITNLADGAADGEALAYDQDGARFTSTDAGAGAGPVLTLYRNSASPAAADLLGELRFDGEDSAGNQQEYVNVQGQIADSTSGSESARLLFNLLQVGTEREILRINGADSELRLKGYDAGATKAPILKLHRDSASPADNDVLAAIDFVGEDDGSAEVIYAGIEAVAEDVTNGTEDGYLRFRAMRAGSEVTSLSPGILYDPIATTSGSSQTQTGIPANARRITLMLAGVGTNGTNSISVQIGDSGGLETSGYTGTIGSTDDTVTSSTFGPGSAAILVNPAVAADTYSGTVAFTLANASTNTWIWSGIIATEANTDIIFYTAGRKALSGTLDRISIQTSDTFDAGAITVLVE